MAAAPVAAVAAAAAAEKLVPPAETEREAEAVVVVAVAVAVGVAVVVVVVVLLVVVSAVCFDILLAIFILMSFLNACKIAYKISGHERNNGEAGLTRFNRSLAAWNAAHGTNYHSSNLCPCPVENCLFFGLSKQLFKLKQTRPEYDLARVPVANLPPPSAEGNPNPPPLPVDFSEAAWSIRGNSSALFMTLSRHFTFNLLPGNRELVTGDVQDAHMANVPECLRSLCKRSNDKTFRTLQTLLGIDPPGYDEDEDEDDDDDVDNDGNN